jgi:nitrite reductase/ring-hydroxylating ferredoxin subunit
MAESRRDFVRDALSFLACGAAGLRGIPGVSLDLPVALTAALRRTGDEAVYPIPPQDGASIDREHEVIVARYQGRVYAFGLSCPHQRTRLRWHDDAKRFQCPKHKSTFDAAGSFLEGRATRSLDRYPLRREGETVVVDLSRLLREDENAEPWRQAVVEL